MTDENDAPSLTGAQLLTTAGRWFAEALEVGLIWVPADDPLRADLVRMAQVQRDLVATVERL